MQASKLDRRTVAICAVIALIVAIAAALVASVVLGDDGSDAKASGSLDLTSAPSGDALLSIPLTTTDGAPTTLADLAEGKPMLVNLWQSSCPDCIDEMPLLEAARADHPELTFVGVDTQETMPDAAAKLVAQTGITYPWLLDDQGDLFYEAQAVGMPSTLLIDTDGTLLGLETGRFDSQAELQAFLDEHLG